MPAEQAKKDPVKKIKVTNCAIGYAGKNKRGDDYTIYEIEAENGDGQKITVPLRSFSPLPIGKVVEVTVKEFPSEKYGMSYTLTPKNKTTLALQELNDKVDVLTARVAEIESRT